MATVEQQKSMEALIAHIRDGGRLALVDTKDHQGNDVTVLCAAFEDGTGDVQTYPVARMFLSDDPTDELQVPEGAELQPPMFTVQ